ncbi:MAG: leucine-rich repeat domain-containing protein [Bacteroidales bacterium]|nr:leucine-rich repeat domain-containing protein [Bacteroidales bacterium]
MLYYKFTTVKILFCFFCLFSFFSAHGQIDTNKLQEFPIFFSFEAAAAIPSDSVFRLSFKRKLPADFGQKIMRYPHLQELHLTGMRLKKVPDEIWSLTDLIILDLSNNRLDSLPHQVGNLIHLQQLILNRNYLASLPTAIARLSQLSYLDLWSNLIVEFPPEIQVLKSSLKTVDMRVINIHDVYREVLQATLPETKFLFSKSCNCKY